MRKCNKCHREKDTSKFRYGKHTCRKCERRWYIKFLRALVVQRRLSPIERLANRLGYMGSAFIMMSPYLLPYDGIGAFTYLIGAVLSIPQVWVAKAWNIVFLNFNLLIGYGLYIYRMYSG